jgi:hypothetical protein
VVDDRSTQRTGPPPARADLAGQSAPIEVAPDPRRDSLI